MTNYHQIPPVEQELLDRFELNIHHAAQWIARFGQSYLDHEADESHPTMVWNAAQQKLIGRLTSGAVAVRIAVDVAAMQLQFLDQNLNILHALDIVGQESDAIEKWLQSNIQIVGLEAKSLAQMPYNDMPPAPSDQFEASDLRTAQAWMAHRTNANWHLAHIRAELALESEINIWPHHFDTGVYFSLKSQAAEGDKAIGIGWAVSDTIVPENYWYVYAWAAKKELAYDRLKPLSVGAWYMIPEGWKGAALPLSNITAIADAVAQKELVNTFLKESTTALLELLN